MDKSKQRASIKQYIKAHGSISNMEAMMYLHIGSFSKRISEINRKEPGLLRFTWEKGAEGHPYKRWYFV